ncbi:MAG: hypothetical protein IPL83_06650 [Bdellovibrionales bacterium]|nr:hypothetical protein [Bdellovibrionales bacterium]MBK9038822.1 hypothetical protein [Bdellovibrionales bacterium]
MKKLSQNNRSKELAKFVLILTVLFLATELGLYFRVLIRKHSSLPEEHSQVLVYGDSIFVDPTKFMASGLSQLNISLIDMTKAALRTEEVSQSIRRDIEKYNPALIVLMLGKSDLESETGKQTTPIFSYIITRSRVLSFFLDHLDRLGESFSGIGNALSLLLSHSDSNKSDCTKLNALKEPDRCLAYLKLLSNNGRTEAALSIIHELQDLPWDPLSFGKIKARAASFYAKIGKDEEAKDILRYLDQKTEFLIDEAIASDYIRSLSWLRMSKKVIEFAESLPESLQSTGPILVYKSWAVYALQKCRAVPLFEQSMQLGVITKNQLNALIKCYFTKHQVHRGFEIIKSLYGKVKLPEEITITLIQFYVAIGKMNEAKEIMEQLGTRLPDDRALYKGQLSLYALSNNDSMLNEVFRNQGIFQKRRAAIPSFDAYKELVAFAHKKGVKVLVLQYPNERDEILEIGLGSTPASLLSTRSIILDVMNKVRLKDLFETDFEHLSQKGACYVGQEVANRILDLLGNKTKSIVAKDCEKL